MLSAAAGAIVTLEIEMMVKATANLANLDVFQFVAFLNLWKTCFCNEQFEDA